MGAETKHKQQIKHKNALYRKAERLSGLNALLETLELNPNDKNKNQIVELKRKISTLENQIKVMAI
jgi:hypothetical protein